MGYSRAGIVQFRVLKCSSSGMAFETESEYYSKLTYEAKRRYKKKLTMENREDLPDLFCIKQEKWVDDLKLWPNVEYGDIYNYLINTKGLYTKESLEAYKSLEVFNFFPQWTCQDCL